MSRRRESPLAHMQDCLSIMDTAIANGGILVDFSSFGSAHRFRARCYSCRVTLRKYTAEAAPPGTPPGTKYDDIYIQIVNLEGESLEGAVGEARRGDGPCRLRFSLRSQKPLPAILRLDGTPIGDEPNFDDLAKELDL